MYTIYVTSEGPAYFGLDGNEKIKIRNHLNYSIHESLV